MELIPEPRRKRHARIVPLAVNVHRMEDVGPVTLEIQRFISRAAAGSRLEIVVKGPEGQNLTGTVAAPVAPAAAAVPVAKKESDARKLQGTSPTRSPEQPLPQLGTRAGTIHRRATTASRRK